MSSKFTTHMWIVAADLIDDVVVHEKIIQKLKPEKNRLKVHGIFASLYVRYVRIVNRLGECFDQTLQVQKREIVRRLLEAATKRMLELQNELKAIEMSEFVYVDNALIEQKLIPQDVELLKPLYYPMRRTKIIENIIKGVQKEAKQEENSDNDQSQKKTIEFLKKESMKLTPEQEEAQRKRQILVDAIDLIKIHEKARQDRILLATIQTNPDVYLPLPEPIVQKELYKFYHKSDQNLLFPIKRTKFQGDFYQAIRTFSQVEYYKSPNESRAVKRIVAAEILQSPPKTTKSVSVKKSYQEQINQRLQTELEIEIKRQQQTEAAIKIQRFFHRYRLRKLIQKRQMKRLLNLGMIEHRKLATRQPNEMEEMREQRRNRKVFFDKKFVEICQNEKNRILKLRSPWIMEDISDHIREWFHQMYEAGGEFDKYPPQIKGGTILVVRGETKSPEEFAEFIGIRNENQKKTESQRKAEAEKEAQKKLQAKERQKAAKLKEQKLQMEKAKRAQREGKSWDFAQSKFVTNSFLNLDKIMEEFKREWQFVDEFENSNESPYMDWIRLDQYAAVHKELRAQVDEQMREEYELLRKALCKDLKKKYKKTKMPRQRREVQRGKRRGPKNVVPFPPNDQSVEKIYNDLLAAGVICSYPKVKLDNFIGDMKYCAYEMRNNYDRDILHCTSEVKQTLRTWTLGMGEINIKKTKSICIAGPPGCGKRFLVHSLCNEIGAVMFNLSPSIVLRYKEDLKTFFWTIGKMAKLFEPSVLFIDGAHYPFIKKITAKDANLQPRLSGNYLQKILKSINANDKIMLIGTTNEPWNSKLGKMKKVYQKIILCPGADYGATYQAWYHGLLSKTIRYDELAILTSGELSALAKVTQHYQCAQIMQTIDRVLDLKRRVFLSRYPLKPEELLAALLSGPLPNLPLSEKDLNKYQKWFSKANAFAKMRANYHNQQNILANKKTKK